MEFKELLGTKMTSGHTAEEVLAIAMKMQQSMALYESGIQEITTKLEILQREAQCKHIHNPIETIKSRVKSIFSIIEKLNRKGYEISMDSVVKNLNDVAGVRVICPYIDDIYVVAERIRRQDDLKVLVEKDYIKNPKPNGYRSYHMVVEVPVFLSDRKQPVRVEIQLRTIAMDFWASLEHQIRYKMEDFVPASIADNLHHCADTISQMDKEMQEIYKEVRALSSEEE
ncbi:MAG: GTP pyrophosphokinase family protein [Negativibacillus sp.]